MAAYTVLANRYRPRTFDDVVGQEDVARVLRSGISSGRAGHAFLFSGPRGVGKTSMARILAKAFNCLTSADGTSCDECRVCVAIDGAGECLDVVEIDGASHNRVENVRELIENLRFRPVEARHRIYIIDEVHMLSTAAFNALLKTLEEPPEHAKFILATTEPLKVPETIRSRCQLFDFRRLTSVQIAGRMSTVCQAEGVTVPDELPLRLARHAQGGMRDALSLLDQLITFSAGAPSIQDLQRLTGRMSPELLHGLLADALAGDTAGVHRQTAQALALGARAADLVGQLTEVLEGLLVTVAGGEVADATDDERQALAKLAENAPLDQVMAMLDVLVEASRRLRQQHDGRLVVEMAVLTLARLASLQSVSDLLAGAGPGASSGSAPSRRAPAAQGQKTAPPKGAPVRDAPGARARPEPSRPAMQPQQPAPARQSVQAQQGQSAPPNAAQAGSGSAPPVVPSAASRQPARPSTAPQGAEASFREGFLAALSGRSLRAELDRYADIRLDGDALVLVLPADGASKLFDPQSRELSEKLKAAGLKVAGRALQLRCEAGPAPSPAAEASEQAASGGQAPARGQAGSATPRATGSGPVDPSSPAAAEPPAPGGPQAAAPQPRRGSNDGLTPAEQRVEDTWPDSERVDF